MGNSATLIPQIVPSKRCFSCDVCCRFPEKDSFLRPFFTREEIQAAIQTGISPEFFPDPEGCQIHLIPNPLPGAEGYICPCFNSENGHCRIYEVRPMDCQLYPIALMHDETHKGTVIGLDTKCPYVKEQIEDAAMSQYVQEVASLLQSSAMRQLVSSNPSLVQRHQDDVIFLYPVEGLTRSLKGKGK
ncbi:MAG: YkgJ family cysteine cluster protein [Nitrospira sp.]|nr:YkgJ family cysteine cluster protein [Nitrospira sp.]